jgi:hypothetical protein
MRIWATICVFALAMLCAPCARQLTARRRAVTTHLLQKVGAGVHTSAAAFWDPHTDGAFARRCLQRTKKTHTLVHAAGIRALPSLRSRLTLPCVCPSRLPSGKVCVVWESATLQVITTVFYVHI